MDFAAHIRERDGKEQSVAEHCKNVSEMAAEFAGKFDNAEAARQIGLLHKVGWKKLLICINVHFR